MEPESILKALLGVFLLVARRLDRADRLLVAWASLPVLASALYWHHDLIFGPRMLGGAAPAWCILAFVAVVGLVRRIRPAWGADALTLVVLGAVAYAAAEGWRSRFDRYTPAPLPRVEQPNALVFVHELWADRVGGRLAARGLRLDSVRTLLTRYHPCQLEAAFAGTEPREVIDECRRQEASDSLGGLGVTNYLWLDDLPGIPGDGTLWARDLGPERNARLLEAHPDRTPMYVLPDRRGGEWGLVPYERGVSSLWGDPPNGAATGETGRSVVPGEGGVEGGR